MPPKLPPELKHTNRQVSFSGEFHQFLDSLESGTVSKFLEELGRSTEEFKKWQRSKSL